MPNILFIFQLRVPFFSTADTGDLAQGFTEQNVFVFVFLFMAMVWHMGIPKLGIEL